MKEEKTQELNEKEQKTTKPHLDLHLNTIVKILIIIALILINIAVGTYLYKEFFAGKTVHETKTSSEKNQHPTKIVPKPTTKPTQASSSNTQSEEDQILIAARVYAESHGMYGTEFYLELIKRVGNYALVEIIPFGDEIEGASIIIQKVGNRWIGQTMGTYFEDWEEKVPELFQW